MKFCPSCKGLTVTKILFTGEYEHCNRCDGKQRQDEFKPLVPPPAPYEFKPLTPDSPDWIPDKSICNGNSGSDFHQLYDTADVSMEMCNPGYCVDSLPHRKHK